MDSTFPTEISPSTQFLLDEMRRMFAESDARWDQRFARLQQCAPSFCNDDSGAVPVDAVVTSAHIDAPNDAVQEVGIYVFGSAASTDELNHVPEAARADAFDSMSSSVAARASILTGEAFEPEKGGDSDLIGDLHVGLAFAASQSPTPVLAFQIESGLTVDRREGHISAPRLRLRHAPLRLHRLRRPWRRWRAPPHRRPRRVPPCPPWFHRPWRDPLHRRPRNPPPRPPRLRRPRRAPPRRRGRPLQLLVRGRRTQLRACAWPRTRPPQGTPRGRLRRRRLRLLGKSDLRVMISSPPVRLHAFLSAVPALPIPVNAVVVFINGGEPSFHYYFIDDADAVPVDASACLVCLGTVEYALRAFLFGGYVGSFGAEFARAIEKKRAAQQEDERSGFLVRAEVLGVSGRGSVGVNLEPRGSPLYQDECALHATQLIGYDGSLDDGPVSAFVYLGAARPSGQQAWVGTAGSTCSRNCPAGGLSFLNVPGGSRLLLCGGEFRNLCVCDLIHAPILLVRNSDVTVEQSWWLSSSAWIQQQPAMPPHGQVEFDYGSTSIRPSPWPSFLSRNGIARGSAVSWEPPWPLQLRQDIRLTLEQVQRKSGGNCQCFLLEGGQLKDISDNSQCLVLAGVQFTVSWSALMLSSSALFGALPVAQSVIVDSCGELMVVVTGFWTTGKEVQCSSNCLSDSLLACGHDKSRIVWDPGAQFISFFSSSFSLWQHKYGVGLSACCVQMYQLQSLLVETYANSKIFVVIYDAMKTWLELNLASVVVFDNSSRFTEKTRWPFVILALLQKQLWPPQAPSASCAYIQDPKCMRVIFFVQQCIIDIDLFGDWDGTNSIQFFLYIAIVLLWPKFLQKNWQSAVCLELALILLGQSLIEDIETVTMQLPQTYLLVLIPRNVSCLEITLVSMQRPTVRTLYWDSGGDMHAILHSPNARISCQPVVLGSSDVRHYPYDLLLKHPWPPPMLLHHTHASDVL